jgi:hypothetical protein
MGGSQSSSGEIEVVRKLIRRVRAGQAQDPIALAEAQERAFGVLMSLEAQLQRVKRASPGTPEMPLAPPGMRMEVHGLMDAIAELSDALTELRGLASPEGGPSRVGYGFVLPGPPMAAPQAYGGLSPEAGA